MPFDRQGADLLFTFITRVYERKSLIVTTNLPFAKWSQVGSNPAKLAVRRHLGSALGVSCVTGRAGGA